MNSIDAQREITHRNVEKLLDAIKADRKRIDELTSRVMELEKQVRSLTVRIQGTEKRSNEAFAVAQQARL